MNHYSNIFKINPAKAEPVQDRHYFTVLGKHDFFDESKNPRTNDEKKAYAYYKNNEEGDTQYYIKVGLYGKVFNPIGLYSEGRANKFLSKVGKNEFTFTRVNQKVFDMYVNFLRTKNIAWLNNAERELT
jgi:hypothetical protein